MPKGRPLCKFFFRPACICLLGLPFLLAAAAFFVGRGGVEKGRVQGGGTSGAGCKNARASSGAKQGLVEG